MEAAGGCESVAGAYFRGSGACTQSRMGACAKTVDPKSDLHYFT